MNTKEPAYRHRLAHRLLEVLSDLKTIDLEMALMIPVEDMEALGKLVVPAQEKMYEIRKKSPVINQRVEYRKRRMR